MTRDTLLGEGCAQAGAWPCRTPCVLPPPGTPLPHQLRPAGPSVGTPRWLLFASIMFGWMAQGGLGVLAAASLFLLPRVNPPVERRAGVRTGVVVHLLLDASWLTGLLGMLAFGDDGDAPRGHQRPDRPGRGGAGRGPEAGRRRPQLSPPPGLNRTREGPRSRRPGPFSCHHSHLHRSHRR